MEVTRLGHARLTYKNKPIVAYTKWSEKLKSNSKIVHCAGMKGLSKGPSEVTITVSQAVPVAGEEDDYRKAVRNQEFVVMEVWETGGWVPKYKGTLSDYGRDDGVDTEPTSEITFVGVPI